MKRLDLSQILNRLLFMKNSMHGNGPFPRFCPATLGFDFRLTCDAANALSPSQHPL